MICALFLWILAWAPPTSLFLTVWIDVQYHLYVHVSIFRFYIYLSTDQSKANVLFFLFQDSRYIVDHIANPMISYVSTHVWWYDIILPILYNTVYTSNSASPTYILLYICKNTPVPSYQHTRTCHVHIYDILLCIYIVVDDTCYSGYVKPLTVKCDPPKIECDLRPKILRQVTECTTTGGFLVHLNRCRYSQRDVMNEISAKFHLVPHESLIGVVV